MDKTLNTLIFNTLLSNGNYHSQILADFINSRSHIRNQAVIQLRDRGNKYDIFWDFYISPNLANSFIQKHQYEYSFYKLWLSYRTNIDIYELEDELLKYVLASNTSEIAQLAQHNSRECYGICMVLFELLNKLYIYNARISECEYKINPYNIVRLASFYSMTYAKYHIESDVLKSIDVLSNFARMQDLYESITLHTLLDIIVPGIGMKYMYIWAMYECCNILPPIGIEYHYFSNALMMHQNQTVGGVVEDALDNSFNECILLGHNYATSILTKYEDDFDVNGKLIIVDQLAEETKTILNCICKLEVNNPTVKQQQFLNKVIQFEDFDGSNIVEPPYISSSLHYSLFLEKIGLSKTQIDQLNIREDKSSFWKYSIHIFDEVYGKPIAYSNETYGIFFRTHKNTKAIFRDITLSLDEKKNVISFALSGQLYPIKKDIDWTNLFYGIPCAIVSYEFPQKLLEDRLVIAVFGGSESYDKTFFDKRYI